VLKLALYRQKGKIYSKSAFSKNKYLRLIESFISEVSSDEVEHGIIENNDISVSEWISALSIFDGHEVDLFSINNLTSKLYARLHLTNVPNFLLGGIIAGLCRKKIQVERDSPVTISDLLGCPDCTIPLGDRSFDRPSLVQVFNGFQCSQCGFHYPCRDGIIFLLPKDELRQLYPKL
jgi:uncharacterized protein YbaR (Trm112 family)